MRVKDIYLLRHGQVMGPSALYGHTDVAVAEQEQDRIAQCVRHQALDPQRVLSSPLVRCQALAKSVAAQASIPLTLLPNWREMHFGQLDGVPFAQFSLQQSEQLARFSATPSDVCLPDAESLREFHRRVTSEWQQIIDLPDDRLLIITHGGVIRMMIAHVLEMDWRHPNWYQKLHIGYATLTHIQVFFDDVHPPWLNVISIAQPLSDGQTPNV